MPEVAMKHSQDLHADVAEVLLSEEQIRAKVAELGQRITADYAGNECSRVRCLSWPT
jgi:hypoxanthine-guanine phosphoribosyltransferase